MSVVWCWNPNTNERLVMADGRVDPSKCCKYHQRGGIREECYPDEMPPFAFTPSESNEVKWPPP